MASGFRGRGCRGRVSRVSGVVASVHGGGGCVEGGGKDSVC